MESIFFYLIMVTVLSFGFHGPLLTVLVRKLDGLTIIVYRNLSFAITMLPLLFLTTITEILKILDHIPTLIFAALCALVAFYARLTAVKNIPFGLSTAIRQVIYVIFAFIIAFLVFGETSTLSEIGIIFIILMSATALSLMKMDVSHIEGANIKKGLFFIAISGIFHTLAFFFFTKLSREINPYVAAYFWEVLIGIIALGIGLIFGGKFNLPKLKVLSLKETTHITLISILAIIGIVSFGFAVKIGDFAIASGLMTATIVVQSIVGYFLLKEKINLKQGIAITGIVLGIVALKIVL